MTSTIQTGKGGAWVISLALSLAVLQARAEAQPTITRLGDLPGGAVTSHATNTSSDGRFVVGSSGSTRTGPLLFRAEAFLWSETTGMIPLGVDPLSFKVRSRSAAVSDDGAVVVGNVTVGGELDSREKPFRWTPGRGLQIIEEIAPGTGSAVVQGMSPDGGLVVGFASISGKPTEAFAWSPQNGVRRLGLLDPRPLAARSSAEAISANGRFIAGQSLTLLEDGVTMATRIVAWDEAFALGDVGPVTTESVSYRAMDISDDGGVVVGHCTCPPAAPGTGFRWTRAAGFENLSDHPLIAVSANGLVSLSSRGVLFIESEGPYALLDILESHGVVEAGEIDRIAVSEMSPDGLSIVGSVPRNQPGEGSEAIRIQFSDCDGNGIADALERFAASETRRRITVNGTERFRDERESTTYGTMIGHYGRPWEPETNQTPAITDVSPAARLRSVRTPPDCGQFPELAERYLEEVILPASEELFQFEMLLGNEAFADAQDSTVGLDGIAVGDLGEAHAFRGVRGIRSLLDEELALLRGVELEGTPDDWINDTTHYLTITDATTTEEAPLALYNRLPPNASGDFSVAYRSNYGVTDNYEATLAYPQGHGDALGYYLSAIKAHSDLFARSPTDGRQDLRPHLIEQLADNDAALAIVDHLAAAMTARAKTVAAVIDLEFRRGYREHPDDPAGEELFRDPDPDRAWSMAEWSCRGALGSYLDWALLAHVTPSDPSRSVHREALPELGELAGAAGLMQARLDTASNGLDPLGLVQNVVPFGIDASALDSSSGKSHYEQVRDAALQAITNARSALEFANNADQRLRQQSETVERLRDQLEDVESRFNQELIQIFGLPSADDPLDNDLDPQTDDFEESRFAPDLVAFLRTADDLRGLGMRPRLAPGEAQLALGELLDANLRLEQAELEAENAAQELQDLMDYFDLVSSTQLSEVTILRAGCEQEESLLRRAEALRERELVSGTVRGIVSAIGRAIAKDPGGIADLAGQISGRFAEDAALGASADSEFLIELERQRAQCNRNITLRGLENSLQLNREILQMTELIRRSSLILIDISVAKQAVAQAAGRLQNSVQRGVLVRRERDRLRVRFSDDLVEERFRDLSFREFRNNSLQKYRAFYDFAARFVVLAARAYAYEFNARSDGEDVLSGIYRMRQLGDEIGTTGGLRGVLLRLDNSVLVNNFNNPLDPIEPRTFSFRENLLGIGTANFPDDDLSFRAFLEAHIVDRVEEVPEIRDLAQLSVQRDHGPGIVLPFSTEIDGRNFFGMGPDLPFGNANFSISRNIKIRNYAIRFDGAEASLGLGADGIVFVYLLPVGDSVLRENNNRPVVEEEPATPWSVVSQFLPAPRLVTTSELGSRVFDPWRSTAQIGGNFLNAVRRERDSEAQIETGRPLRFNTNLAGRSAWNTRWLLVIPGAQWTGETDPEVIRSRILQFIYGSNADPGGLVGITDIRLILQAYSH